MRAKYFFYLVALFMGTILYACRGEEPISKSEQIIVDKDHIVVDPNPEKPESNRKIKGFFLLNEGNMGSNRATLDYFDYETGIYSKNIYAERNPSVVKELGDVGNDLQIYGNKLYAVINCSHLIEVMDLETAKHITTISIPNCRYITFDKGYAYVSSYAGPVQIDPNARLGYIARIDTTTLQIKDVVNVGYQPEEMVIKNNKLYVANSGGYKVGNYDRTISVIDLSTFTEIKKIDVGVNLHRMKIDKYGDIYVTSRGDYSGISSNMYIIDTNTDTVKKTLNIGASEICIDGDLLYAYCVEWNRNTQKNSISYATVDTRTEDIVTRSFITDGSEKNIEIPYGIAVNPETKEIIVTDAQNYVTSGYVYYFSPDGKKKWSVKAGNIPAHIAFTTKRLKAL